MWLVLAKSYLVPGIHIHVMSTAPVPSLCFTTNIQYHIPYIFLSRIRPPGPSCSYPKRRFRRRFLAETPDVRCTVAAHFSNRHHFRRPSSTTLLPQRSKATAQRHPAPNNAGLLCRCLLAPPRQTRCYATLRSCITARSLAARRSPPRADARRAVDAINPQRSVAQGIRRMQEPGHQDVLWLFRQQRIPWVCGVGPDEARSIRTAAVATAILI